MSIPFLSKKKEKKRKAKTSQPITGRHAQCSYEARTTVTNKRWQQYQVLIYFKRTKVVSHKSSLRSGFGLQSTSRESLVYRVNNSLTTHKSPTCKK